MTAWTCHAPGRLQPSPSVKAPLRYPAAGDTPPSGKYRMQHQITDRHCPCHEDESQAPGRRVTVPRSRCGFLRPTVMSTTTPRLRAGCRSLTTSAWSWPRLTSSMCRPTSTAPAPAPRRNCPWGPSTPNAENPHLLGGWRGFSAKSVADRMSWRSGPTGIEFFERFVDWRQRVPLRSCSVSVPEIGSGAAVLYHRVSRSLSEGLR